MPVRSDPAVREARLFHGMLRNDCESVFQRRLHEQNVEEKTYAETQRGLYEARDTQRSACGGRRPKPVPRTEVTKRLWAYIKKHGLQDKKNKRMINADTELKAVFGGKSVVNMFEMTKLVGKHLK